MSRKPLFNRAESATQVLRRPHLAAFLFTALLTMPAFAAQLAVAVKDRQGAPLNGVVVTVSTGRAEAPRTAERSMGMVMDQRNMRFVPEVLVVPMGGSVSFPNSDTVSHQVYSFSAAKRFQIPLYKGSGNPPVIFDKAGLVTVGCNIHDQMVGYIYVTDARWFGETDANGTISFADVPAGNVKITIWSPRIADAASTLTRETAVAASGEQTLEFRLAKTLRAQPEPRPRNPDWDY